MSTYLSALTCGKKTFLINDWKPHRAWMAINFGSSLPPNQARGSIGRRNRKIGQLHECKAHINDLAYFFKSCVGIFAYVFEYFIYFLFLDRAKVKKYFFLLCNTVVVFLLKIYQPTVLYVNILKRR